MIILNKPYVSDFLVKTAKDNGFETLDNETSRKYFDKNSLTSSEKAVEKYLKHAERFYSNSENSINWILENLPHTDLSNMIKISKNKVLFREKLQKIYPDYFFKSVMLAELPTIDVKRLKFPFILKPAVGFLSFGVYPVYNEGDWHTVLKNINSDLEKVKGIFPTEVVDTSEFILEEMISGEEFAIDAYFDNNGKTVILNIFQHPFFGDKDVSDRAYYTSKSIIKNHLKDFTDLLDKIGEVTGYKNFPFHLELRTDGKKIIPIELNPMRFCGWCITDIAHYAWGINVYEAYLKNLKPDWDKILEKSSEDYFYFTIGDIPSDIDRAYIRQIDFDGFLKNISHPLEVRKIDYKQNPVFAIVFGQTPNFSEIENLLKADMRPYIRLD